MAKKQVLEFDEAKANLTEKKKTKKVLRPKRNNDSGCYVTNSQLLPEVLRAKELGKITPELAIMMQKIAERYAMSKNYAHLSFREDMVAASILNLMQNGLKFKPEKSNNPFSYYTQCCYHTCLQVIADEKKQRQIRDDLLLDSGFDASLGYMENERDEYRQRHSDMFEE
jgi:hypothetical protein